MDKEKFSGKLGDLLSKTNNAKGVTQKVVPLEEKEEIAGINILVPRRFKREIDRYCFENEKTMKDTIIEAVSKLIGYNTPQ
jgi:hypothetical protein